MGFGEAIKIVLQNGETIGVVSVMIIVFVAFMYAVLTERLHIGNEFRRMSKRSDTLDVLVTSLTAELTAAKVSQAEARVRIEFLTEREDSCRKEIERLNTRLEAVERERDRIISSWVPPTGLRSQER